jgi:hypothetical protein
MRKINTEFLQKLYESFSFIMPKSFREKEYWTAARYGDWSLIDTYKYTKNLKLILNFLNKLVANKKNKILFILDPSIYLYYKDFIKDHQHFFTDDIKSGLEFMQRSPYSKYVVCVVYIGKEDTLTKKKIKLLNCPVLFFASKLHNTTGFDYISYNSLNFHSSLFFLKLLLKELLKKSDNNKQISNKIENN